MVYPLSMSACTEIPCLNREAELKNVYIRNDGYIWNCGLKEWNPKDDELITICELNWKV